MTEPQEPITVVGAGLAGCEAAVALARAGERVLLVEMKPAAYSPAHTLPGPAELVCSNSLKSDAPDNAHGLLKAELRALGSVILEAAERTRVPAGSALAVDRVRFSEAVAEILATYPSIQYRRGVEIQAIPGGEVILATGPLTTPALAGAVQAAIGGSLDDLYFYDALAPIIDAESIDRGRAFCASRWGKGDPDDYLNCPLDRAQYQAFLAALRAAPRVSPRQFEEPRYFEGCLPVEVLAERGDETLVYGPMRPVGLSAGEGTPRPYAVVQLRAENREKTAYNLVGFQTKLTQPAQREVFGLIPGLQGARFLRYGAVHRNLYVNAPAVLDEGLALIRLPRVRLAGQVVGVEGYIESAAMGLLCGRLLGRARRGLEVLPPPPECALGALYAHVRGAGIRKRYEPMNIHFGLLPEVHVKGQDRRRQALITRARAALAGWIEQLSAGALEGAPS